MIQCRRRARETQLPWPAARSDPTRAAHLVPIRFIRDNNLTKDDKRLSRQGDERPLGALDIEGTRSSPYFILFGRHSR